MNYELPATEFAPAGFPLPTFSFEPPTDKPDQQFITSFLAWALDHPEQDGLFGQQPYTNPPAHSGIRIHKASYDLTAMAVSERHADYDGDRPPMAHYTGWWVYFTYHDSFTSPFHSPLFLTPTVDSKATPNYYTWEY